ncbi:MAG: L,D-transpeptidase family protein [Formivibrio sp.]|nr:L,D-transpeptidase family protein [Formivibrio sp.]
MKRNFHIRLKRAFLFALLLALAPAAQPIISQNSYTPRPRSEIRGVAAKGSPEEMIVAAIDAIRAGRTQDAKATLDRLLELEPNYRLAYLLRADLYAMRAMPLTTIGGGANAPADRLEDLRREAQVRIKHYLAPPPSQSIPANLLTFGPEQKYAVVVDVSASRLYLFENHQGEPRLVTDNYVTIGKLGAEKQREGDQRTPIGVYFVTGQMTRNQLDKTYGAQADLYGIGAWPISYPNEWDRHEGRTGHGIWLHGSPALTYARPPQASNGCVVLTNPEMKKIADYLQLGVTPVVITEHIDWVSHTEWKARQEQALAQINNWRSAWEKLDTARYLGFYDQRFQSEDGQSIQAWKRQKIAVNNSKQWAKVKLDDLSIFSTGGASPLLVSSFSQEYQSNNLNNRMKKRLYWKQENGNWRIVWEGVAKNGA